MRTTIKVTHLSFNDWGRAGGTSVALCRLHWGLQKSGHESKILCRVKNLEDSIEIPRSRIAERAIREFTSRLGLNDLHAISSFGIKNHPAYKEADILHLQSLHSGYFNYLALPALTRNKPTVWTIHDLWAITGHCGFPDECERWKTGCGKCPHLKTYPPVKRDGTAWEWKLKQWAYKNSRITIIVSSAWFRDIIKQSLLKHFPVHLIPFGIDTGLYQPLDKKDSRVKLGLPPDKTILMFSTTKLGDPRKGGVYLKKALAGLPPEVRKKFFLITTGKAEKPEDAEFGIETKHLGYVDNERMPVLYSAADLFVFPTLGETFGLVALESMACGTPVVAFGVGGVLGHVRHGITGYTAKEGDVGDLARGISSLAQDHDKRMEISRTCRSVAVEEYSESLQIRRYVDLYKNVVSDFKK